MACLQKSRAQQDITQGLVLFAKSGVFLREPYMIKLKCIASFVDLALSLLQRKLSLP
jgi:hypothetical protein